MDRSINEPPPQPNALKKSRNDPNLEFIKLQEEDTSRYIGQKMDKTWRSQFDKRDSVPNLKSVFFKTLGKKYLRLFWWRICWILFMYVGSYVLIKFLVAHIGRQTEVDDKDNEVYFVPFPNIGSKLSHLVAICLFLSCGIASICIHRLRSECTRIGIQVRASIMVLVYRKSLRLHSVFGETRDVVNLIGDDGNAIAEAFVNFHFLWSALLELIIVVILSGVELGLAGLPILGILLLIFPIQYLLANIVAKLSQARSNTTSIRVHLMSEILTAFKLVKFYAWEDHFNQRIAEVRRKELNQLGREWFIKSSLMAITFGAPVLATVVSLQVYRAIHPDELVSAEMVFTLVSIFNTLRYPLYMLPNSIQTTRAAMASFDNLEKFLNKPEVQPLTPTTLQPESDDPNRSLLEMDNCTFSWSFEGKPVLKDLNLKIKSGQIIAVVGDVGAGKSSILSAIMGQMVKGSGDIKMGETPKLSYCPSEPWILSAALRDNVVFGSKFEPDRYRKIVKACALNRDFKSLTHGDRTEIGERGYNLTLGQRHRVSIGRAVYSDSDIVLMDDPLSSMDPRVAKHIFKECIQNLLKDKAVVFVTNQLHFLPYCHHIMVMRKGKCFEQGSYEDLMAMDFDLKALVGESIEIEDPNAIDDVLADDNFILSDLPDQTEMREDKNRPTIKIVEDSGRPINHNFVEERREVIEEKEYAMPTVSFSRTNTIEKPTHLNNYSELNEITVSRMIDRVGGGGDSDISKIIDRTQMSVLGGAGLAMNTSTIQTENNALARAMERNQMTIHSLHYQADGDEEEGDEEDRAKAKRKLRASLYLKYFKEGSGLYVAILLVIFFFLIHAIRIYNDYWLMGVSDSQATYDQVGFSLNIYSYLGIGFLIGLFIRGILFVLITNQKNASFHNNMLSPIMKAPMSYFEYTPLSRILHSFASHLHIADEVLLDSGFQALQFMPLVLGTFVISCVVVPFLFIPGILLVGLAIFIMWYSKGVEDKLMMYGANTRPPLFSHLSATLEGLHSIRVYKIQARFDGFNMIKIDMTNKALLALTLIKCWTSLYIDLLSCLFIYLAALLLILLQDKYNLTQGTAGLALTNSMQLLLFGHWTAQSMLDFHSSIWSIDQLVHYKSSIIPEGPFIVEDSRPDIEWPQYGRIEFFDVSLRYHRYEIAVLKNVSFVINPRDRVAIVGSTGSGKTTLLTSLLRLVEIAEGYIEIDGIDIASIGLQDLRSRIAVIPQEPVLFYGTVRSNLDPDTKCTDSEIWSALSAVHLADRVRNLDLQLDHEIVENGIIFTFGQRQLFCIARAILLKCRILILDEATSAVDLHTEHLIQDAITDNFKGHTVLFVGHRLNSIVEADKVLVMDMGRVVEFDSPERLLNNPQGHLYNLVIRNGAEAMQTLLNQAIHKTIRRTSSLPSGFITPNTDSPNLTIDPPIQLALLSSEPSINQNLTVQSHLSNQTINSNLLPKPADMPRSLEDMFVNPLTPHSTSSGNIPK